jgi:hypothetical protein
LQLSLITDKSKQKFKRDSSLCATNWQNEWQLQKGKRLVPPRPSTYKANARLQQALKNSSPANLLWQVRLVFWGLAQLIQRWWQTARDSNFSFRLQNEN